MAMATAVDYASSQVIPRSEAGGFLQEHRGQSDGAVVTHEVSFSSYHRRFCFE